MSDVNKKIKRIQVPVELITKPKQFNETYLYIYLKMMSMDNHVRIYKQKLMNNLLWKSNKTLNKYLQSLKEKGYITYDFESLPISKPIEIDIDPIGKQQFTQVDIETIDQIQTYTCSCEVKRKKENKTVVSIEDLKERALTLFYYYETYYNTDFGYAFPTYSKIREETGLSYEYIKIINKILHKAKLVNVSVGDQYIDEETGKKMRERNKYTPNCIRYKTKKKEF